MRPHRLCETALLLLSVWALVSCSAEAKSDPLSGKWLLNRARSHYGPGAQPRKRETFECDLQGQGQVRCKIEGVMEDGKRSAGAFVAAYDGKPYAAIGIAGIDRVVLRKVDDFVADASFTFQGRPVFGYRAVKSDDGSSLMVISVDPVTRKPIETVVVYDRQAP